MELLSHSISSLSHNTSSSLFQPVMYFFSSALLLGSVALQSVMGRPSFNQERDLTKRAVDDFISFETPIALQQLLCNIGASGCHSSGVASGLVIASPDKQDPDCK